MKMEKDLSDNILKSFRIAWFRFILTVKEDLILPPYKGSTLRGGFGIVLRRICCINKKADNCGICLLKDKCIYANVFETSPSSDCAKLRNISEIPRPFVIEAPLETKTLYRAKEIIEFKLILIGKAADYLPYFVLAFKELGNSGIGKQRGKFILSGVYNWTGDKIYDCQDETAKNINSDINLSKILESFCARDNEFSLFFFTPTRIKIKNDLIVNPEFHVIIRALLHRLSALSYFHCGEELDVDYNKLISEASGVKIKASALKWEDWERYSSRQQARMKLGGFIGKITYEGRYEAFLPLLLVGQYTHIGKNCTFGLGKYELRGGLSSMVENIK